MFAQPLSLPDISNYFYYDPTDKTTRETPFLLTKMTIPETACWLNFTSSDPEVANFLSSHCNLPDVIVKNLNSSVLKAHNKIEEDGIFLSLCGFIVNTKDPALPEMVPLNIYLTEKRLITVSGAFTFNFEELLDELQLDTHLSARTIFNGVIAHLFYQIENSITAMQEKIFTIESLINSVSIKKATNEIWQMRKVIIGYLHHFHTQEDMLGHILSEKISILDDSNLAGIKSVLANLTHCTKALHSTESLAMALQSKIDGLATDATNKKVFLLSIMALFVVPLNLLGSLMGMNVPIPGQTSHYAFTIVMGGGALITLSLYIFFRIKKWL